MRMTDRMAMLSKQEWSTINNKLQKVFHNICQKCYRKRGIYRENKWHRTCQSLSYQGRLLWGGGFSSELRLRWNQQSAREKARGAVHCKDTCRSTGAVWWERKQGQPHRTSQARPKILVFILRAIEICHRLLLNREVKWWTWPFVKVSLAVIRMIL